MHGPMYIKLFQDEFRGFRTLVDKVCNASHVPLWSCSSQLGFISQKQWFASSGGPHNYRKGVQNWHNSAANLDPPDSAGFVPLSFIIIIIIIVIIVVVVLVVVVVMMDETWILLQRFWHYKAVCRATPQFYIKRKNKTISSYKQENSGGDWV